MYTSNNLVFKSLCFVVGYTLTFGGFGFALPVSEEDVKEENQKTLQNNLSSASSVWSRASSISFEEENRSESIEADTIEFVEKAGEEDVDTLFALASNPDAPVTFYLDFDGGELENTHWNKRAGADIVTIKPFSLDSDDQSLSVREKSVIHNVWAKVSATFAQFDVNVTTMPPTADKVVKNSDTDEEFGVHVMFTEHELPIGADCNCNGIATDGTAIRVSENQIPSPAFVNPRFFIDEADYHDSAYDFRNVEAASFALFHIAVHEIGHTLGLSHDGSGDHSEYGPPMGALSFFMGATPLDFVGMARWSDGSHTHVFGEQEGGKYENFEDDISILEKLLPVREDDFANNLVNAETAYSATNLNNQTRLEGILTNHRDRDWVRLDVLDTSIVRLQAGPAVHNHQLAVNLRIVNASGAVPEQTIRIREHIAFKSGSKNRALRYGWNNNSVKSKIYTVLKPGIYFVEVSASPGNPVGYVKVPEYGSMGPWVFDIESYSYDVEESSGNRFKLKDEFTAIKEAESR
jgi:hypothetical protein